MKKISLIFGCLLLHSLMLAKDDGKKWDTHTEWQIRADTDRAVASLFPIRNSQGKDKSYPNSFIASFLLLMRNGAYHYLGVLPWGVTDSTQESNPFTFNFNPVGKYLAAFILTEKSKKALQRSDATNTSPFAQEIRKIHTETIRKNQLIKETVMNDIRDHFPLLFDPATGILK